MKKRYVLLSSLMVCGVLVHGTKSKAFVYEMPPTIQVSVPTPIVDKRPVDIVFVLDTTGSMGGMIDGAKKKIWEIARLFVQAKTAVSLRVGLVAYRDIGDAYVTKHFDLTDDLDSVYEHLSEFVADGGGDTPEHVSKALAEAVSQPTWSQRKDALKVIYLVGDAPPQTKYQDGYSYKKAAKDAERLGIRINAIRCGNDQQTLAVWQEIAKLAKGDVSTIEQSGGVVSVPTPYDDELSKNNQKLMETAVPYGRAEQREKMVAKAKSNSVAPAGVQADRAAVYARISYSGGAAMGGGGDLVTDFNEKKADLNKIESSDLPESMRKMTREKQQQYLVELFVKRKEILSQIRDLSDKRDEYLRKQAKASKSSLDGTIMDSLRRQAKEVQIVLP